MSGIENCFCSFRRKYPSIAKDVSKAAGLILLVAELVLSCTDTGMRKSAANNHGPGLQQLVTGERKVALRPPGRGFQH